MINNDEVYVIKQVEPVFTEQEIEDMGVKIIDNLDDKELATSQLLTRHHDAKLTISELGPIKNSSWAVYVSDLDSEFISDLWRRSNFYSISLTWSGYVVEEVKNAYINPNHLIEDIEYYINHQFERNSNGDKCIRFAKGS